MSEQKANSYYQLCSVERLRHAECLEFSLPFDQKEAFLLNWQGDFHAYLNNCPHTLVALNWTPNQFLDIEMQFLQCSLHGALFEPDTGLCIRGPCLGQSLTALPLLEHGGKVCIDLIALKSA
jgi:nitrite reductase/ring-hydroxylating ferredoxin subunit